LIFPLLTFLCRLLGQIGPDDSMYKFQDPRELHILFMLFLDNDLKDFILILNIDIKILVDMVRKPILPRDLIRDFVVRRRNGPF
jgi:hypothetical protein